MKEAIAKLSRQLGLPGEDAYTQYWAHELPPEYRTHDYFARYLAAASSNDHDEHERSPLMELMLVATNDLLGNERPRGVNAWESVEKILQANPVFYESQIEYWSDEDGGDAAEDLFPLTPHVRTLKSTLKYLLPSGIRPEWAEYPKSFRRILEQNLIHLTPWHIMETDEVSSQIEAFKKRYPSREISPSHVVKTTMILLAGPVVLANEF
jgi:hypothetical protein